jgi:ribosomal protein S18 acetylase RimI-like enzyme
MITVRPAQPADEAALAQIDAATWTSIVTPAPSPAAGTAFFRPGTQSDDVLVAEVDGVVAGYAKLAQPTPLAAHAHVLELGGLAVGPSHQRAGIGRRLVEASVEEARRRGARKLSLRVLGHNGGARQLYASCGFVVEGVLAGEFLLDGRYVDDILMARDLLQD